MVVTSLFIASIIYIFNPPITQAWSPCYVNRFYNTFNKIYNSPLLGNEARSTSIYSTIPLIIYLIPLLQEHEAPSTIIYYTIYLIIFLITLLQGHEAPSTLIYYKFSVDKAKAESKAETLWNHIKWRRVFNGQSKSRGYHPDSINCVTRYCAGHLKCFQMRRWAETENRIKFLP